MAAFTKAHAIKAALLAGILLVIFNLMNTRLDNKIKHSFSFSHASTQWPKRTHSSSMIMMNASSTSTAAASSNISNIYTILWNSDKTTLKNVTFNAPISPSHHNNSVLLVDSSDFKRKFSNHEFLLNNSINNNSNNTIFINNLTNSTLATTIRTKASLETISDKNSFIQSVMTTFGFNTCPLVPPNLEGPIEVNTTTESLESIDQRFASKLLPGGWYHPKECNAHDRVAVIVPFRDRHAHLPIFLKNIHPFLMKQQIEYGIFIIEQTSGKLFNRAALMNVGFLEASKLYTWDCFIFHDIDLLPLDDRNLYTCPDQPRHMSVAIDIFGYKLPYVSIFGGVSAMTTSQFKKVNGFSNSFWGWGGEDDDMSNRLKHANFHISRYPVNIARYMMLNHPKEKANPKRYENLANGAKKFDTDGINSVKYETYNPKKMPLFTWFLVELEMPEHR